MKAGTVVVGVELKAGGRICGKNLKTVTLIVDHHRTPRYTERFGFGGLDSDWTHVRRIGVAYSDRRRLEPSPDWSLPGHESPFRRQTAPDN
jgi:hypothetical protein